MATTEQGVGGGTRLSVISFITDNPYRLLNVGSSTLQLELRRKAKGIQRRLDAGLPVQPGLAEVFGSEEIARCPDIVHTLTSDPKSRTVHRLFWPFHNTDSRLLVHQEDDDPFDDDEASADFTQTQLSFLRAWYDFLITSDAISLQVAFDYYYDLYQDGDGDQFLLGLLAEEGEGHDIRVVHDAQEVAMSHMSSIACRIAMGHFENGDPSLSASILQAVCASPFHRDLADRALIVEVRPVAEREVERIKSMTRSLGEWTPDLRGPNPRSEVSGLVELSRAVEGRMAGVDGWFETAQGWVDQWVHAMRAYAVGRYNDGGSCQEALEILRAGKGYSPSASVCALLNSDISTLHDHQVVLEHQQGRSAFSEVSGCLGAMAMRVLAFVVVIGVISGLSTCSSWLTDDAGDKEQRSSRAKTVPSATPSQDRYSFGEQGLGVDESSELRAEREELFRKVEALNSALSLRKAELDREQSAIDSLASSIDWGRSTLDQTDRWAVDEFNRKVREYNSGLRAFQSKIDEYNADVRRLKDYASRIDKIDTALN